MITLSSIFRNSVGHINRYFDQIDQLRGHIDVRLVLGEGDNIDETAMLLNRYKEPDDIVVTVNHGGPVFGSADNAQRWTQIAQVVRGVIDAVKDPGDAFVYVEGDLIWKPETILDLIEADRMVAPMVFAKDDPASFDQNRFYDTWGARQGGAYFLAYPPYYPAGTPTERYVKVDSCGSCFAIPGRDWHIVEAWDGTWPFTANGGLWMDSQGRIRHP
jgi:hypothetical protein